MTTAAGFWLDFTHRCTVGNRSSMRICPPFPLLSGLESVPYTTFCLYSLGQGAGRQPGFAGLSYKMYLVLHILHLGVLLLH